ncbi:Cof-type HAD-IIB family hydrolase [Streptomyces sp. NBC_00053]|uniref:Cof-type HAD-IIB family hydrolase n=1 Tax=unclassified Streptomyces TaxID=2593676 RepID=UPI002253AE01|nr:MULTISPECIES: Cof-type HAD-IIB family hydrolase [unclassified Streptomyces]WSW06641.1 Cof-type HAD-IIB family hydrolase [Streptomyces sp. NBC_01005]WTC96145.1 Cof-type HAD-IIB family hydrolase [Streptomyces sp. NBC_01650]MCX4395359.1 Cof-type HAD-IIB family hydrolase [Streptomyces sp. NBC_01767]MCX5102010.1 Cof-type HAD-IIB family hydrolase [Streptomyces sp. NBC_00439]MCX5501802.1 Cof-type HAD-IIB family hydrolase [Streptomyces sp. NBC_00052]
MTSATDSPPPATVRLIATDLDGTLLRDDKTVSDRTVAALAAAEEAGIEVFFVTGRPARWMDVVSDHVHGHGLAICANGAAVADLHAGGELIEVRPLERAIALDVVRSLRAAAPGTTFAVELATGIHYEPDYPPFHLDPGATVAVAEKLLHEESPGTGVPVLKLLAHHAELAPDDFLALARTTAGDRASFTRSSPTALLEISGPGVSKASTLELCCAERGISPAEVVAFGDMPNDVEMLSWAGTSYAMGNAHPAALAAASGRTTTNGEDGVAVVIERIIAERRSSGTGR